MFDKYGLNPLTEVSVNCVSQYQFFSYHWCFNIFSLKLKEHILKLKRGTSCVLFIGQLVQASFPERYFYDNNRITLLKYNWIDFMVIILAYEPF
jgi:hypothetical protein